MAEDNFKPGFDAIVGGSAPAEDGDKPQKAVALKYDRDTRESPPRIVATGVGSVAEQIIQLAFVHDVKVREDADLVEILSKLEVDTPIPLEAFSAVAEILSYVYRAQARHHPQPPSGV
jgi:flagellar biosynthesis protein